MLRWTATRIAEHIEPLLRNTHLILVSNREPYIHRWHRQAPLESDEGEPSAADKGRWDLG